MSEIKLSVTIVLPGRTMMSSQACDENPQKNYEKHVMKLSAKKYDPKTRKSYTAWIPLEYSTRKCTDSLQVIKMYKEAYDYMVSPVCPDWYLSSGGLNKWKKMPKTVRLEEHLRRLCTSMGGKSYTYAVFDD